MPHTRRPCVEPSYPHHVTVRLRRGTWNLRAQRCYQRMLRAFRAVRARPGFRITHFSVQGNHVHMLVEAQDRPTLSNGMRAVLIRFALTLNRLMGKRGPRFVDRYHESILGSATAVRRCLRYVLENHARHMAEIGKLGPVVDRFSSAPWFNGYRADVIVPRALGDPPVSPARSWLLSEAWRFLGLLPGCLGA
jgi:REP element-mobilizing transposase RayT